MVTFEFYRDSYLGSAIEESAFSPVAARAEAALERIGRCCRVQGGEDARRLALCAMAEAIYAEENRKQEILQETVGEMSVRYTDPGAERKKLSRELYQRASLYLDIYRGVSL